MDFLYTPDETKRVEKARESFSGRLLTNRQFDEAMAITGILEREIATTGAFKEKLGDYAYSFARSQKFDAMRSEKMLRDLFKERVGVSMNEMRKQLADAADRLTDEQKQTAYDHVCEIGDIVQHGNKKSFYRAFCDKGQLLATQFGVTDACAKSLMVEEFRANEGSELFDWGKELDQAFYRPQIEAEKQEREASQTRGRSSADGSAYEANNRRSRGPEMRR